MLTNTENKVINDGNGTTTVFSFPFPIFIKNDLKVYKVVAATGVATLQVLDVDYTVVLNTSTEGGTVTYAVAPTALEQSLIYRDLEYTQPEQFPSETNFPEERIETMGDRASMLINQLREAIGRALKLPITTTVTELELPLPSAGKTLKWKADESGLENSTVNVDDIGPAVTAAQAAQSAAETAQGLSEGARDAAVAAQGAAETAQTNAETAETNAELAETNAETAETNAETAQTNAEAARDLAQTYANALTATSTTSNTIGTGTKTFSIPTGKQFTTGMWMFVVDAGNAANWMFGQVTAYSGPSISINATVTGGSGTSSSWTLSMCGIRGATGATGADSTVAGPTGPAGDGLFNSSPILSKSGTYTLVAADREKLISCTSTFTLTLPAIVDGYVYKIANTGAGTITIAPNGAETSEVISLTAGQSCVLIGNATATKWHALVKAASAGGTSAVRGTFADAQLNATAGIVAVTHSLALSSPYTVDCTVFNTAAKILPTDVNNFTANGLSIDMSDYVMASIGACTMTIATPCVVTRTAHGYSANQTIMFKTTGALPTGLTAGQRYYVKAIDANTFNVAATSGGANINTSGSQSGVHTLYTYTPLSGTYSYVI